MKSSQVFPKHNNNLKIINKNQPTSHTSTPPNIQPQKKRQLQYTYDDDVIAMAILVAKLVEPHCFQGVITTQFATSMYDQIASIITTADNDNHHQQFPTQQKLRPEVSTTASTMQTTKNEIGGLLGDISTPSSKFDHTICNASGKQKNSGVTVAHVFSFEILYKFLKANTVHIPAETLQDIAELLHKGINLRLKISLGNRIIDRGLDEEIITTLFTETNNYSNNINNLNNTNDDGATTIPLGSMATPPTKAAKRRLCRVLQRVTTFISKNEHSLQNTTIILLNDFQLVVEKIIKTVGTATDKYYYYENKKRLAQQQRHQQRRQQQRLLQEQLLQQQEDEEEQLLEQLLQEQLLQEQLLKEQEDEEERLQLEKKNQAAKEEKEKEKEKEEEERLRIIEYELLLHQQRQKEIDRAKKKAEDDREQREAAQQRQKEINEAQKEAAEVRKQREETLQHELQRQPQLATYNSYSSPSSSLSSSPSSSPSSRYVTPTKDQASNNPTGPLKKDGTPDMRYSANIGYTTPVKHEVSSNPTGPLKQDGTPDMRYSANRSSSPSTTTNSSTNYTSTTYSAPKYTSSSSTAYSTPNYNYNSCSSSYSSPSYSYNTPAKTNVSSSQHYQVSSTPTGPTKRDGTPDMRYSANRR